MPTLISTTRHFVSILTWSRLYFNKITLAFILTFPSFSRFVFVTQSILPLIFNTLLINDCKTGSKNKNSNVNSAEEDLVNNNNCIRKKAMLKRKPIIRESLVTKISSVLLVILGEVAFASYFSPVLTGSVFAIKLSVRRRRRGQR